MAAGKNVEIRGVIGSIRATPSATREVEVVARISRTSRSTTDVKVVAVEDAQGVVICALYPNRDDDRDPVCQRGGDHGRSSNGHSHRDNDNDRDPPRVDFEVRVPSGVEFDGNTVVGDVSATGMTAYTTVASVTGSVHVETTDLAEASSVSGSVYVVMGRTDWSNQLDFSSVSGDVTVEMPDRLNTDFRASTVSGDIDSDWPVTINSRIASRTVRGTIGSGGRQLTISTVSGDITLRKRN
jgi:hypothetical protein